MRKLKYFSENFDVGSKYLSRSTFLPVGGSGGSIASIYVSSIFSSYILGQELTQLQQIVRGHKTNLTHLISRLQHLVHAVISGSNKEDGSRHDINSLATNLFNIWTFLQAHLPHLNWEEILHNIGENQR